MKTVLLGLGLLGLSACTVAKDYTNEIKFAETKQDYFESDNWCMSLPDIETIKLEEEGISYSYQRLFGTWHGLKLVGFYTASPAGNGNAFETTALVFDESPATVREVLKGQTITPDAVVEMDGSPIKARTEVSCSFSPFSE